MDVSKAGRHAAWIAFLASLYLGIPAHMAFAHASLVAATPADAAVLPDAPAEAVLRFSEAVTPLVARLIHPDGRTEILKADSAGVTVRYFLPERLERGTHILSWRVTSADGHPVGGGQLFSIGAPSAAAGVLGGQTDMRVMVGIWVARLLLMIGLIFGIGGRASSAFLDINPGRGGGRLVAASILAGLAAAPVLIGLQGLDALGEPLSAIWRRDVWAAGLWSTAYGAATLIAAAGLLSTLVINAVRAGSAKWPAAAMLVVAATAFASAGHASTAPPRWLTTPAVFLHSLSVVLWIGALVPLADILRQSGEAAAPALRRFSIFITPVVLVLLSSGLLLSIVQIGGFTGLRATQYGFVLSVKLVLVLAIFGLAALNRYRFSDGAIAGSHAAIVNLRRAICLEILLALAVLGVVGLWRFTPPPRELSSAAPSAQSIAVKADGLGATLILRPALVGPVEVDVDDLTLDGKPFKPLSVAVELSKPAYGIGPFVHDAVGDGRGHYIVEGNFLPIDGFWVVRLTALVSDFRSITATDVFDVRTPGLRNSL